MKCNTHLLTAYLQVKKACARTNTDLGLINLSVNQAISQACDEILSDPQAKQVTIASLEESDGMAIDTKVNQLLANRAEKFLNGKSSENKPIKPEIFANTEDAASTFCLVTRLAVLLALSDLEPHLLNLERLLRRESLTLAKVLKVNFAQIEQASTGQWSKRLNVFATAVETVFKRIKESTNVLLDRENPQMESAPIIRADQNNSLRIKKSVLTNLAEISGYKLKEEDEYWQGTFLVFDLLFIASALRDLALVLSKVATVAQLVSSTHPNHQSNQPPSAINPPLSESNVSSTAGQIAESLKIAAYQVISNNLSLTFLAQSEQLEGHLLMPLLSDNLLADIDLLRTASISFIEKGLQ